MNAYETDLFSGRGSRRNGGRKGIAYDWQSIFAAEGLAAIEAELAAAAKATWAVLVAERAE